MAYSIEKDGTVVIKGFEKGIASSPYSGLGNLQCANIATEPGEVMENYARTQQSMTSNAGNGTLAFFDSSHVSLSISGSNNRFKGMWISVINSSNPAELPNANYYVLLSAGSSFSLSTTYNGSALTGFTSGLTANISLIRTLGTPMASATEIYQNSNSIFYRYYILDNQGLVWVYDTANDVIFSSSDNVSWFLPDTALLSDATGIGVLNGWLFVFYGINIACKPTVWLGGSNPGWESFSKGDCISSQKHFGFLGHQGRFYYTDSSFLGEIFPNTSLVTLVANIQSYCQWSGSSTTGTVSTLISGTLPLTFDSSANAIRIPAVFFSPNGGHIPSALSANKLYYIQYSVTTSTFQVFSAATGGTALDISSGSSGIQYFNTFYPTGAVSAGNGSDAYTFAPQKLVLPSFETAQCMAELGNTIVIGCNGDTIYSWGQINLTPDGFVQLPESNTANIIQANNVAYCFTGSKGNIYVTNGSALSLALTVPDYCAGIPSNTAPLYVEPYFVWGGATFMRGRIWFSIQDQTSTKTGNCGGIWSFVPSFFNPITGQDVGLALRMENQNSYGTYNGVANVILAATNQNGLGPQYWAAWTSSISSATYGIDFTANASFQQNGGVTNIETDIIPTGTLLGQQKKTFSALEFKLAAPKQGTIAVNYRLNLSDAWQSCGTLSMDSSNLSGMYMNLPFQATQWIQFQVLITPASSTQPYNFDRFTELRLHP